jgi:hypothetical protein
MSVKLSHTHTTGKQCYVTSSRGHREERHALVNLAGYKFGIGYVPFCSHWYAYDLTTGREVASFDRTFYEQCIAHLASPLIPDPECENTP